MKHRDPGLSDRPTVGMQPKFCAPFRPRRKLLYGLIAAMAAWIGVLLTMYFVTVHPYRSRLVAPPTKLPSELSDRR